MSNIKAFLLETDNFALPKSIGSVPISPSLKESVSALRGAARLSFLYVENTPREFYIFVEFKTQFCMIFKIDLCKTRFCHFKMHMSSI